MNKLNNVVAQLKTREQEVIELEAKVEELEKLQATSDIVIDQLRQGFSVASALSEARKTRMEALWSALAFVLADGLDSRWAEEHAQFLGDARRLVAANEYAYLAQAEKA